MASPRWVLRVQVLVRVYSVVTSAVRARGRMKKGRRGRRRVGRMVVFGVVAEGGDWDGGTALVVIGKTGEEESRIEGIGSWMFSRTDFDSHRFRVRLLAWNRSAQPLSSSPSWCLQTNSRESIRDRR